MGRLAEHLRRRIAVQGPLTVAEYMADCLGHPRLGYYATKDPLGAAGDFITAPEISQMFGELIGLWCAEVWGAMGAPEPVILAELGPGRGSLMADVLRATRTVPAFAAAVRLHLVETSPALRQRQRRALDEAAPGAAPAWHDDFSGVPEGPLLLAANEFFDALPVRQFERTAEGWRERLVDAGPDGFRLVLAPGPAAPLIPQSLAGAPPGSVVEFCAAGIGLAHAIASRLARFGGAALIVDYGHGANAIGETLQAVKDHAYHGVLESPGEADLTAHVDFAALARAAAGGGARFFGPVPQGRFLESLGIGARAEALAADAAPDQAADIEAARRRLTGAEGMGTLFKAAAIQHPDLPVPPGFA